MGFATDADATMNLGSKGGHPGLGIIGCRSAFTDAVKTQGNFHWRFVSISRG